MVDQFYYKMHNLMHYLELLHNDQELLEWQQKSGVQCFVSSLSTVPPFQSCEQNNNLKFCSGIPPKSETNTTVTKKTCIISTHTHFTEVYGHFI